MNIGIENENQIIRALNDKTIDELSENFKEPIRSMYKYYKDGEKLIVKKVSNWIGCKTDITIQIHNYYHNVSIKSGFGPAVHEEEFDSFFTFLKSLNISQETLDTIKFYHYGDGTLDGSGKKTLRLDEFKEKYKERIAKANEELSNEEIVKAVIFRCVVKGRNERNQEINYFYYGNVEEGIFLKRDHLLEYGPKLNCYYDTAIHFGPLSYNQKIHKRLTLENGKYAQFSQLVWPNIKEGVVKIKEMSLAGASFKSEENFPLYKEENKKSFNALKKSKQKDVDKKKQNLILISSILGVFLFFLILILIKIL